MNFIDLLVFLWALAVGVRGYRRGMVLEGLEAFSALGGLAVAHHFHRDLGRALSINIGVSESFSRGLAFIGVALAIASSGYGLAWWLSKKVPDEGAWARVDSFGGLVFGAAKGVVYSGLALVLIAQIPLGIVSEWTYGSAVCRAMFALLPELYESLDGWM